MKVMNGRPAGLRRMDSLLGVLSLICLIIAGVSLVVMTSIFGWLVYGRYVLNSTPTWVEQVSLLLIMVISFLGAAVGVNDNTHLSVAAFRTAVPRRVRTVMVVITDVLMAGFGGLMFWYGAKLTMFKWSTLIPLIQMPEGLRTLPLTVGGALILMFSVGHLIRLYLGYDTRTDSIE